MQLAKCQTLTESVQLLLNIFTGLTDAELKHAILVELRFLVEINSHQVEAEQDIVAKETNLLAVLASVFRLNETVGGFDLKWAALQIVCNLSSGSSLVCNLLLSSEEIMNHLARQLQQKETKGLKTTLWCINNFLADQSNEVRSITLDIPHLDDSLANVC